jgi:hypothetical protein
MLKDRRTWLKIAMGGVTSLTRISGATLIASSPAFSQPSEEDSKLIEAWLYAAKSVDDKTAIGTLLLSRFVERVYFLMKPIAWKPGPAQDPNLPSVQIPIGFVTDFASIPRIFWSILPPDGEYTYAAIIHDYLYWNQATDKPAADLVLKAAMEEFGVSKADVFAIYNGVKLGGQSSWDENAALKSKGEKRILKVFPDDPKIRWEDWKRRPDVFA